MSLLDQSTTLRPVTISEYVIFDLEANADHAHPPKHEIIEIGALLIRYGEEADRFETLVRPIRPLRPQTRELTGIAQEMVCLLYTSPSPRDRTRSRMPSSA